MPSASRSRVESKNAPKGVRAPALPGHGAVEGVEQAGHDVDDPGRHPLALEDERGRAQAAQEARDRDRVRGDAEPHEAADERPQQVACTVVAPAPESPGLGLELLEMGGDRGGAFRGTARHRRRGERV